MGESVYASHHMIFVLALSWPLMQLKQITRLWLHVSNSAGTKKLLFSPDTDVYHIGLTVCNCAHDVYVIISPLSSLTTNNLHLNHLLIDLAGDPSLALIPVSIRPQVLQTLFIASGCDCISFFAGFGKTSVLKCFYENAWFVSGTQEFPGTLADTMPTSKNLGLLAFIRQLVQCISKNIYLYLVLILHVLYLCPLMKTVCLL